MLTEKKKAVGAWNTALFFNPSDKKLANTIAKTNELIQKDKLAEKQKKLVKKKKPVKQLVEMKLMGVFAKRAQAYTYASKLRKQNFKAEVEELDNGKYAVKIPKTPNNNSNKGVNKK